MIDYLVDHLMLPILQFFHGITGSYGWAIICLTLVIKGLLLPLTVSQFKSMQAMQKLQPRLKELQERYKGKPEELNKRVMELYKDHRVNPLGGCLPLLIQLPFLFALYAGLVGDKFKGMLEAAGHPGWFFIENLARTGAYSRAEGLLTVHWDVVALIVFFGLSTFWTQKMMTTGDDPMQRQMLYMMPAMVTLTFVLFPIPAGVLLYIVVSNIFTLAQNYAMKRSFAAPAAGSQPPAETKT